VAACTGFLEENAMSMKHPGRNHGRAAKLRRQKIQKRKEDIRARRAAIAQKKQQPGA
jgi:hypothetical protein